MVQPQIGTAALAHSLSEGTNALQASARMAAIEKELVGVRADAAAAKEQLTRLRAEATAAGALVATMEAGMSRMKADAAAARKEAATLRAELALAVGRTAALPAKVAVGIAANPHPVPASVQECTGALDHWCTRHCTISEWQVARLDYGDANKPWSQPALLLWRCYALSRHGGQPAKGAEYCTRERGLQDLLKSEPSCQGHVPADRVPPQHTKTPSTSTRGVTRSPEPVPRGTRTYVRAKPRTGISGQRVQRGGTWTVLYITRPHGHVGSLLLAETLIRYGVPTLFEWTPKYCHRFMAKKDKRLMTLGETLQEACYHPAVDARPGHLLHATLRRDICVARPNRAVSNCEAAAVIREGPRAHSPSELLTGACTKCNLTVERPLNTRARNMTLVRTNHMKAAVSLLKLWTNHAKVPGVATKSPRLVNFSHLVCKIPLVLREWRRPSPTRITYEELQTNAAGILRQIGGILNVSMEERVANAPPTVHKTGSNDLRKTIVNFDDIANMLSDWPCSLSMWRDTKNAVYGDCTHEVVSMRTRFCSRIPSRRFRNDVGDIYG